MQNTNAALGQSSFTAQQTTNVRAMNPATPVYNNNYSSAMPAAQGTFNTQQGPSPVPRAPPRMMLSEQMLNCNRNGMNYNMAIRNHPGASMTSPHGNARFVQRASSAQPGFVGRQMANVNGGSPAMAYSTSPNAVDDLNQFSFVVNEQHGAQFPGSQSHQVPQNHNNPRSHQTFQSRVPQNYQFPQNHQIPQNRQPAQNNQNGEALNVASRHTSYENSSGRNTPINRPVHASTQNNTPSPGHNTHLGVGQPTSAGSSSTASLPVTESSPSGVGTAESGRSSSRTETAEEFQNRVAGLVADQATTFKDIFQNDVECARFEAAIWKAKRKGDELEDKSEGYTGENSQRATIKQRIFDALLKIDGEQDPVSESAGIEDCLAVRTIQRLSDLEVEVFAHKLMVRIPESY